MIISNSSKLYLLKNFIVFFQSPLKNNFSYTSFNKISNNFSNQGKQKNPNLIQTSDQPKKTLFKKSNTNQVIQTQNQLDYDKNTSIQESKKLRPKQNKDFAFFFQLNQYEKLNLIEEYKEKEMIKQLSMIVKQMLIMREKSQIVWTGVQECFISLLKPTEDQNKIRSLSKYLYSLAKSKRASRNYETGVALLLPYSSAKSFTQLVVSISRMGGMSQQFGHIVQKLYWKRKSQFGALQINLLNYVLAKNGRKIDSSLIQHLNSFSIRQISLMLKTYDKSRLITPSILKKCVPAILARRTQTNFFDLKHLINVYTKYQYLDDTDLMEFFSSSYRILSRNVNQQTMEQIWQYIPMSINNNKLAIEFVDQLIRTLRYLKTKGRISEKGWKKIASTFSTIENLQIRTNLQKIERL